MGMWRVPQDIIHPSAIHMCKRKNNIVIIAQLILWTEQNIPTVWRALSCTEYETLSGDETKKKVAIIFHSQSKNANM